MSDTPRTDAMEYYFYHDSCAGESIYTIIGDNDVTWSKGFEGYSTPSDFSRQLERELAEVTKQRDDLLESLKEVMPYIVGDRCVPWKKAQDAIDRATEGGAQ